MIMLLYQPGQIYDISFQLSVGSTAGIIFCYLKLEKYLSCWPECLRLSAAMIFSAQLGILPFTAWYFNNISLIAIAANIIIMPFIELTIILGLAGILAAAGFCSRQVR